MGNASSELTQGGHFFGLNKLRLGCFQAFMRNFQLMVGLFDFSGLRQFPFLRFFPFYAEGSFSLVKVNLPNPQQKKNDIDQVCQPAAVPRRKDRE